MARPLDRVDRWLQPFDRWWRWLPVLAWFGFISYWSSQSQLPIDSPWFSRLFHGQQHPIAHACAFGIQATLVRWAVERTPGASLWAFLVTVAFGALDEFHQAYSPHRDPDIHDLIVDALAAAFAVLLVDAGIQIGRARQVGQWHPLSYVVPAVAFAVTLVIASLLLQPGALPPRRSSPQMVSTVSTVAQVLPDPVEQPLRTAARAIRTKLGNFGVLTRNRTRSGDRNA